MKKQIKPIAGVSLFCIVLLFLASCKGSGDNKDSGDTTPEVKTQPVTETLTTGLLDTLYIDRQAFDTLQNGTKLVFSFTFKNPDTLTLHGWRLKNGNKFDSLPNIRLKNLRASTINYGAGKYFGNVVLTPNEFNKIKTALTPEKHYVLFAPFLLGNNIAYRIFVSDGITTTIEHILVITPTGAEANPSPPKVD